MAWLRTIFVIAGILMLGLGSIYGFATPKFTEGFLPFSQNTAAMGFILGICVLVCFMRWVYLLMCHDGWTSSHLAAGLLGCVCAALHLFNYQLPDMIDPRAVDFASGLVIIWTGVALGMTGLLVIPDAAKRRDFERPRKHERDQRTPPPQASLDSMVFDDDPPPRGKVEHLDVHRRRQR